MLRLVSRYYCLWYLKACNNICNFPKCNKFSVWKTTDNSEVHTFIKGKTSKKVLRGNNK